MDHDKHWWYKNEICSNPNLYIDGLVQDYSKTIVIAALH